MLRSINELQGFKVQSQDEPIGTVEDFYFDDHAWIIRYLVIDTEAWLSGKKILISPISLDYLDWKSQMFLVNLTHEQVKNSPEFDADKPISRQMEELLTQHYGWPMYWKNSGLLIDKNVLMSPEIVPVAIDSAQENLENKDRIHGDPHLRSVNEVVGYNIQARDGEAGHIEDFIVGDKSWRINYMAVDTGNWLSSRKVLVSPTWIEEVKWLDAKVRVDLTQETVRDSPEYNPSTITTEISKT